jgi:hypothetical protein
MRPGNDSDVAKFPVNRCRTCISAGGLVPPPGVLKCLNLCRRLPIVQSRGAGHVSAADVAAAEALLTQQIQVIDRESDRALQYISHTLSGPRVEALTALVTDALTRRAEVIAALASG